MENMQPQTFQPLEMQPDPLSAEGGPENHPETLQTGSVPGGWCAADEVESNRACLCQNILMRPLCWPWELAEHTVILLPLG